MNTPSIKKSFILLVLALVFSNPALADVYWVTNINDLGAGSLRQAIMDANAHAGNDEINFDVNNHAMGSFSIKVQSPLPAIVDPVKIDGFTQAGEGVHAIEISGELLPSTNIMGGTGDSISQPTTDSSGYSAGLVLWGRDRAKVAPAPLDGTCVDLSGTKGCKLKTNDILGVGSNPDFSTIRGLAINKFPRSAIVLFGADNVTIIGNYLGLDTTGKLSGYENGRLLRTTVVPFGSIRLEGSNKAFIGTTEADYNNQTVASINRNVIGASVKGGIELATLFGNARSFGTCAVTSCQHPEIGFKNNVVQNNYIGTDKDGSCIIGGGGTGTISLSNDPNLLCAPIPAQRSLISNFGAISLIGLPSFESANGSNVIGGLTPGQGNLCVSSSSNSIVLTRTIGDKVYGNVIGQNAAGTKILWGAAGGGLNGLFVTVAQDTHVKANQFYKSGIPYPVPVSPSPSASAAPGVVLSSANGVLFEDNIIDGNGGSGMDIIGTVGGTIKNNTIINNSFVRTERGGLRISSFGPGDAVSNSNIAVVSNYIGTDSTGTNKANNGPGIVMITGSPVNIGFTIQDGKILAMPNVIAFNRRAGIVSAMTTVTPSTPNFAALYNTIYANGGTAGALGIDLVRTVLDLTTGALVLGDGPNLNDLNDVDNVAPDGRLLPNGLQNFPELNAQRSFINPALVIVEGVFNSIPDKDYLLQFYSDDSALCFTVGTLISTAPGCDASHPFLASQGRVFIGEILVHTDSNGNATYRTPAKVGVPIGKLITATATSLEMIDSMLTPKFTSEFSQAINVDRKGSQNAFDHASGAAGGDGDNSNSDPGAN